jgi:hypothetical protein
MSRQLTNNRRQNVQLLRDELNSAIADRDLASTSQMDLSVRLRSKGLSKNERLALVGQRRDWINRRMIANQRIAEVKTLIKEQIAELQEIEREDVVAAESDVAGNPLKLRLPGWRSKIDKRGIGVDSREDS